MKKICLMALMLMPVALYAQTADNFTIKGKVGNLNAPARAYLTYEAGGKNVIDSTTIVNGEFKFHGHINNPFPGFVVIDPAAIGIAKLQQKRNGVDALNIYVDKANIVLTDADSVSKAQITGSKLNDDNAKLKAVILPFVERGRALSVEYKAAPEAQQINPAFQDTIQARYAKLQNEQTAAIKQFILANPNSYVSLESIRTLVKAGMDIGSSEVYYNALSPEIKQSELGKGFGNVIAELKVTAIGSIAPDFTQKDVNGTPVKLLSFRGKYVLLDFWASWCPPCRQENPHIVRVFNRYKTKNFTIVGVSLDKPDDKALWLKAIKDDGLQWTQVSDLKFWDNEVAALYKIDFVPQNFLIDPKGKIIGKNLKGADLDNKMSEIFKM